MRRAVVFGYLKSINVDFELGSRSLLTENARVRRGISGENQYSDDAVKRHIGSHDGLCR
jgi:hypothetical protein